MDKLRDVVGRDSHIIGGNLVFKGTNVPVSHLFNFVSLEPALREFLSRHPEVRQEQAIVVLEAAREMVLAHFRAPMGVHEPEHPVIDLASYQVRPGEQS